MKGFSDNSLFSSEKVLIAEGLQLTGDMILGKSGIMNGKIKGNIHADGKIVIGEKGRLDGDLSCNECEIFGKVKGDIRTHGAIRIGGKFKGRVAGSSLEITEDADVDGIFHIGSAPTQWRSLWKQFKMFTHQLMRKKS